MIWGKGDMVWRGKMEGVSEKVWSDGGIILSGWDVSGEGGVHQMEGTLQT